MQDLKTVNEGASALKTGIGTLAKSSKDLNNGAATLSRRYKEPLRRSKLSTGRRKQA